MNKENIIYVVLVLLALILIWYFFIRKKPVAIDSPVVSGDCRRNNDIPVEGGKCGRQLFAVKEGKTYTINFDNVNSSNKYYKTEAELTEDGINTIGNQLEITKQEYEEFCGLKIIPKHKWYCEFSGNPVS